MGDKVQGDRDVYFAKDGAVQHLRTNAERLTVDRMTALTRNLNALETACGTIFIGGLSMYAARQHFAERIAAAFHSDLESARFVTARMIQGEPMASQAVRDAWRVKFLHTLMTLSEQVCPCENCRGGPKVWPRG